MTLRNVFLAAALAGVLHAQSRPQFEVASIKPSGPADFEHCSGDGVSPGTLTMKCNTMESLIEMAYGDVANGPAPLSKTLQIAGAPGWIKSDPYDIQAKMPANATPQQMTLMLQALLADRLQLKIHREMREQPVYALTVARGGLKLQPLSAACTLRSAVPPAPGQNFPNFCGTIRRPNIKGQTMTIDLRSMSMAGLTAFLSGNLDRNVIDKTGVPGIFDFHLEFAIDDTTRAFPGARNAVPSDDPGPSIFTAIQQLGLRLESDKGPVEFLVIDHVEKPSEN